MVFSGRASAEVVDNGRVAFSTKVWWRESIRVAFRTRLALGHGAFSHVIGGGEATWTPTSHPFVRRRCQGPVRVVRDHAAYFDSFSDIRPRIRTLPSPVGRSFVYPNASFLLELPISGYGIGRGAGSGQVFTFCGQESPMPDWRPYALLRIRRGRYRYHVRFPTTTSQCGAGVITYTAAWSGQLTVSFGRSTFGHYAFAIGPMTYVNPIRDAIPVAFLHAPPRRNRNHFTCR